MRKRDELADPASCMSRARDDEMTFVLLGRDRAAPAAVRAWIEERVRLGKNARTDPQIVEAEAWIEAVVAEQNGGCPADGPFSLPLCLARTIAVAAVEQLFVNGAGERADRLVLTSKDGRDLGGWADRSVADVVQKAAAKVLGAWLRYADMRAAEVRGVRAGLEAAARACESLKRQHRMMPDAAIEEPYNVTRDECAAAVRAIDPAAVDVAGGPGPETKGE